MRSLLHTLLLLSFAANGIACACPSGTVPADDAAHAHHVAETERTNSCDDCDTACNHALDDGTEGIDEAALLSRIAFDGDGDTQLVELPRTTSTQTIAPPGPDGPDSAACRLAKDSPVSLHDRMLD